MTWWTSSTRSKNPSRSMSTFSSPKPTINVLVSSGFLFTIALAIWLAYRCPTVSLLSPPAPSNVLGVRWARGSISVSPEGRAVSNAVGEAADSGTCIWDIIINIANVENIIAYTHCANRPPWETVSKILSAKYMEVRSVCMPLTGPATCLVAAGNGDGTTPLPISIVSIPFDSVGIELDIVVVVVRYCLLFKRYHCSLATSSHMFGPGFSLVRFTAFMIGGFCPKKLGEFSR